MDPCFDCGSTVENHHTPKCELCEDDAIRDLPAKGNSQYWVESPAGKAYRDGAVLLYNSLLRQVVNSQTELPGAGAFHSEMKKGG